MGQPAATSGGAETGSRAHRSPAKHRRDELRAHPARDIDELVVRGQLAQPIKGAAGGTARCPTKDIGVPGTNPRCNSQTGAGTQQSGARRPWRRCPAATWATRSLPGDLQRMREWIILLERHDSGTKRGILLSRPKNNRYGRPELTAMSFSRTAVPACRPAPDSESAASESIAASNGYCRSKARREAIPAGVRAPVHLTSAGHRALTSGHSEAANHCRPTTRGSDNSSRHAQGTPSQLNRSINSESGGRADG